MKFRILRLLAPMMARLRGRGIPAATSLLNGLLGNEGSVVVTVGARGKLEIPLWDSYWMGLALGFPYEPEVHRALDHLVDKETAFIDCGANIGYWSVWAAERARNVVSIEASPVNYERLLQAAILNGNAFAPVHRAVWKTDDDCVEITTHTKRHAGDSVVDRADKSPGRNGYSRHRVKTISIPTLLDLHSRGADKTVLKLDIEGAETTALRQAKQALQSAPIACIYEDHGQDAKSTATKLMLDLGMTVWWLDYAEPQRIFTSSQVKTRKTERARGYNLLATNRPDMLPW